MSPPVRKRRPARTVRATRTLGLLVIVLGLAGVVLAYTKPSLFSTPPTMRAMFTDVSGLGVTGRDVRVAGAPVGQITHVERVGDKALLTLSLDQSVSVHTDATAELRPHLPFEGTAYVDLQPGSAQAPKLGDRVLSLSHTKVYVPVDEALRVFTAPVRAATRSDARSLAAVLSGAGVTGLRGTLRGAPALTATLAPAAAAAQGPHGTELAGSIQGLSRTVTAFNLRQAQLVPLMRQTAATMAALASDGSVPLDRTLVALPGALSAVDSGSRALDGIITQLDPLASELAPGLARLAPALSDTEPLLHVAAPALASAPPLIDALRGALDAGAAATPATDSLLGALSPSLTLLDASLLPALLAPTMHLHVPAYLSFINLFEGGGGASQPFQTAAQAALPFQTGVGHFMRFGARFFTGAGLPLPPCTLLAKASTALARIFAADGVCQS
ncbi:MAG: MlaD family protein [Solirubrobacteraceae bacterium]